MEKRISSMKKYFFLPIGIFLSLTVIFNINLSGFTVGDIRMSPKNKVESLTVEGNHFCNSCSIILNYSFYGRNEEYRKDSCSCGQSGDCFAWFTKDQVEVEIEFRLFRNNTLIKSRKIKRKNSEDSEKNTANLKSMFLTQNQKFDTGEYKLEAQIKNTNDIASDTFYIHKTGSKITLTFSKEPDVTVTMLKETIGVTKDNTEESCKLSSCISFGNKCIEITDAEYVAKPNGFVAVTESKLKYGDRNTSNYDLSKHFKEGQKNTFPISSPWDINKIFTSTVNEMTNNELEKEEFVSGNNYRWSYELTVKCPLE